MWRLSSCLQSGTFGKKGTGTFFKAKPAPLAGYSASFEKTSPCTKQLAIFLRSNATLFPHEDVLPSLTVCFRVVLCSFASLCLFRECVSI